MIRFTGRPRVALAAACSAFALGAAPAGATPFTVGTGTTVTVGQTLTGAETGTVETGGTLETGGDAIVLSGASSGIVIENSGTIRSTGDRGIDTSGGSTTRNVTLNNNAGALLSGDGDGFRIAVDAAGSIGVNNWGTIESAGDGQAIDFDAISSGNATVVINNYATGVIRSTDADAIRPGQGGVVNNYGEITSNSLSDQPSDDGVDLQGNAATVNNYGEGTISGARHGITTDADVTVYNAAGASITGRNGSGVGSDGDGSVTNHGTITGAVNGSSAEGDGDGVDIDFTGTIVNYGVIQGTGAAGTKEDEVDPNTSEGIAIGGGLIENHAGALISGADNGILVDDGSGASAHGAVTILNLGTIAGLDGYGIRIVGAFDDVVTNGGSIVAASGSAIDLGGGNDVLNLQTGSAITGAIDGGAGTDAVHLTGTGTLSNIGDFETLDADGGNWTLTGDHVYADGVAVADGAVLGADGATIAAATLQVAGGGKFEIVGAGGTVDGDVVNDGSVELADATVNGGVENNGDFVVAGAGATVNGGVMNGGIFDVAGAGVIVNGDVENHGTFRVTESTATFNGTFYNDGTYVSDPSTQTFDNLVVGANGIIQAGAGDIFEVAGDFSNASTRGADWNTRAATLRFIGSPGTTHQVLLAGEDLGAEPEGYVDNFAWATLVIDFGNVLELGSGLGPADDLALYAGSLIGAEILGDAIVNIIGNGFDIYYDISKAANAYLGGRSYALAGGGQLVAATSVPEPASIAVLLAGIALAGVALRRPATPERRPTAA